ncbi:MAG: hypothetical protein Alpg2KO_24380 [Alphaproteobacteria bacterium]
MAYRMRVLAASSLVAIGLAVLATPSAVKAQSLDELLGGAPTASGPSDAPAGGATGEATPAPVAAQPTPVAPTRIINLRDRRATRAPEPVVAVEAPQLSDEQLEEELFRDALQQLFPLNPEQIEVTLQEWRKRRNAADRSLRPTPRILEQGSIAISLEPGSKTPNVQLAEGEVTALTFFDITGNPYPVSSVVLGNPEEFSVEAPQLGGNLITVSPLRPNAAGNLVISLVDQPVPIIVRLSAGGNVVNYRVDMRIQARGPNAPTIMPEQFDPGPPITGEVMTSLLDGVTPEGAVKQVLEGNGPARAWKLDGVLYLRTPMTLISPNPTAQATGAAGIKVYEMPETPVILASDDGKIVRIRVREPETNVLKGYNNTLNGFSDTRY